jgi:quercetin dioxygenase-like cupin family protein
MERVGRADRAAVAAVDRVHLARLAVGDRTGIQRFEIEARATVPEHSHRHGPTGFVSEGELPFVVDGAAVPVGAGESFTIPGEEPHAAEKRGDVAVRGVDVFAPRRPDPDRAV